MGLLEPAGVPCGPIQTLDQVFDHPQVKDRGLRMDLPHTASGTVPQVANPIRFSRTAIEYDRGPPMLGEHTDSVLREELGMGADEIAALRSRGVL
jgi:crotonobetainyl-CoA:carnitine CoA-transferase CaiB-like acyl-CoA transferase